MRRLDRATRRAAAWLAAAALLLSAVLPGLAQALDAPGAARWVEVCTASGSRWAERRAAPEAAGTNSAPTDAVVSDHCPWCSLHTPPAGPPPALVQAWPAAAFTAAAVPATPTMPRVASAWASAQPRAPPAAR